MTRRIRTSLIVLTLLLGALWRVGHLATAQTVPAYPLDPEAFASLGASPFTSAGTYTINASQDQAAPTLSGPGIATPIQGVFFSPSGGSVARDEIAVFTFDVLSIPAGVTVQGAQNANSRPIALLSRSTATIDGTVHVSGAGGGSAGSGGNAGPGGGGGGGGDGDGVSSDGGGGVGFVNGDHGSGSGDGGSVEPGGGGTKGVGGAFGGCGGSGTCTGFTGGVPYGDLSLRLQGGSGGGGGGVSRGPGGAGGGGGGGGAVEVGAVEAVSIEGTILANGGAGGHGDDGGGGGGGAGGGILVHAPVVSLLGALHATGGAGGTGGGHGGGGRVLILTADGTLESGTLDANVNVASGGTSASNGVKELEASDLFNQPPVAQCQDLTVAAGPRCTATASIDNGSFDPDADLLTLTQAPPGPYALGETSVTLTAADRLGRSSSCSAIVTVRDLDAPVIQLQGAEPMTLSCRTAFVDPGATATDNCGGPVAVTPSGAVDPAVPGSYVITYSAADAANNTTASMRTVTVVDTAAPTLTLRPAMRLWPANHRTYTFTASQMVQSVSDACQTSLALGNVVIEKVTSDEPDDVAGDADGSTTGDVAIAANCQAVQVRAERDDTKNGRVYVVTLRVTDASGNTTRRDFTVSVPVSSTGGAAPDGPAQMVTSSCS